MLYNDVMTNIKIQQKEYNVARENYQLMLPLNYEVIIPEDDSVRLLSQICEELDYEELNKEYSQGGRKAAIEPKIMFKIIVYGYMNYLYSSRRIEQACCRDINFMWLLEGAKAPDHSTISRFRKERLGSKLEGLFVQFTQKLHELGEVKYENIFIDGTKIEANANRYTFVWRKAVEKNEAKMLLKVQGIAEELEKLYFTMFTVSAKTINEDMKKMEKFLTEKKEEENIEFVYGAGRRKSNIQKLTEALKSYQERQLGYDANKENLAGRNSYSKTDKDATFMRMKDDHMRNGQLKPAYNVQIAAESEYVVGVGVFSNPTDVLTLKPMLANMLKQNTDMIIKNLIGDAGYESEENYVYLESLKIKYYIKPQTYEQQKKRNFKTKIGKRENMVYDAEKDEYTCHNNKKLKPIKVIKRESASGYKAEVTVYECENCEGCPHKTKCTKAQGNRRMEVSKTFIAKRQKSQENIESELGVKLRINRSIQVEGAFGVLKEDRQFDRFLTRGSQNVETELLLLCFGYNVNKLHNKIQSERTGKDLHELKAA